MIIDLHTHSYYSPDGELSISDLLSFYSTGDIVALTDHETIAGWKEFKTKANQKGIKPIWGVEWFLRDSCHILSYFVDEIPQEFYDFMVERRLKERYCMRILYDRAKSQFSSIPSYEDILASKPHPENILGLTALAHNVDEKSELEDKKAVDMLRDEKRQLQNCEKPLTFSPEEIIQQIHDWNGISVLAHPYKKSHDEEGRRSRDEVQNKVRELAKRGIKGVELFSDGSITSELEHLQQLARELNLSVSVGSDYHYQGKGVNPKVLEKLDESIKNEVTEWLSH